MTCWLVYDAFLQGSLPDFLRHVKLAGFLEYRRSGVDDEMGTVTFALAESSIQLVPDGTLVLHLVIILVMVAILNSTLFKPINRILAERDRQTRGRLEEAQRTFQIIDQKLKDYERSLREARAQGYQEMERQRAEALNQREAQLLSVKGEVSQFLAGRKEELIQQTEDVRKTLSSEARRLAFEISSRILGRPVTGDRL